MGIDIVSKQNYNSSPDYFKKLLDSYADGINA